MLRKFFFTAYYTNCKELCIKTKKRGEISTLLLSKTANKPGSVLICHLSRPVVTGRLHQPTLRVGRATLKPRFIWFFNP